jgi:hypothetical protein
MREAFDVAINPGSTAESPASSFSAGYESVQSSNSTVYPGGPIVDDPEYGQTWFAGTPEVLSVRKPHARVQTGEHDRPNRVPVVARSLAITVSVIVAILMVIIMTNWRPDGEPVRPPIPIATRRDEARPPLDTSPPDTIRKPVTAKPDPNIPSFEMPDGVPVATGSRVTVNWSPVQGVEEYVVETANSELSGSQVIGRTKTTVYTVQPSIRTAYLRVTSVTADGRSVSSRWWPLYSARPDLVVSEKRMEGEVFTLRWWPTLGVVKYEVELRDATETRTWSAAQTVENSYNMEFPRAASSLRIVAIDSKGHRNEGIWIPVSSIQTSSFDTKQRDRR